MSPERVAFIARNEQKMAGIDWAVTKDNGSHVIWDLAKRRQWIYEWTKLSLRNLKGNEL